jgi:UPF0148 protein
MVLPTFIIIEPIYNLINGVPGMEERNPDDIMAECLLAGGKMLSKACRACGSPLFEVKGETLCVVCREKGKETGKGAVKPAALAGTGAGAPPLQGEDTDPARELRLTISALARKAREEPDPERSMAFMEAARKGAEALSLLQR